MSSVKHRSGQDDATGGIAAMNRRQMLKLMSAGALVALPACTPRRKIVPYVDMPERLVPGEPQVYASALPLQGYARGVLVTAMDGRPIKISGNPRHPASLGATDLFGEAEILSLYDPDRARAPRGPSPIDTWDSFLAEWLPRLDGLAKRRGEGLALLSGRLTSPTALRQLEELRRKLPKLRWYAYEPAPEDGDPAVLGPSASALPRLEDADVVITLDADPLGPGPAQLIHARGFARRRVPGAGAPLRLYAAESAWSLTGAKADHRLAAHPRLLRRVARALAARLGAGTAQGDALPPEAARFVDAAVADIERAPGRALVLGGPALPAATRALCHRINRQLGAPVDHRQLAAAGDAPAGFGELLDDLRQRKVSDLVILEANPAYDAAPTAEFAGLLKGVPFSACLALAASETSSLCRWHLPASHPLEEWSDLRAVDGTASIVQPLIGPLYDTRNVHRLLAMLSGEDDGDSRALVRATWSASHGGADFEGWWRQALYLGVVPGTSPAEAGAESAAPPPDGADDVPGGLVAVIRPDPTVFDGRMANNAWLQECPKPISKEVWSNSVGLSPETARRHGLDDGDVVLLETVYGKIEGHVSVDKGAADEVAALTLGYGRQRAGAVGTGLGYNAYGLVAGPGESVVAVARLAKTGRHEKPIILQDSFSPESKQDSILPLMHLTERGKLREEPRKVDINRPSLLPPKDSTDPYQWGMVIDAAACIGCNACVVACQSENNVPVVGPEEAAAGRFMHWLRIDRYELDDNGKTRQGFEPVPCMQCEHAPCEPVCPVEASVHDSEGLNVQVYNRCVGTRFCQANCPYKVRRFNWFGYASGQEYANLGEDPMPARENPDVTVRARGVMEKCTYCVQRISRARRDAEKSDRPIADGEVVTACQSACPTRAITFGNLKDPNAAVSRLRRDPRHFAMLAELGTRPRTTYLAALVNPSPMLDEEEEP
ncbi:MAG: 4Fe-4S dicluster domain-containing protein [Alphaproteobacteria bacterium]|nr:4Fe-4S dicluster domain-containing protein [Alphaproteobacteria bacterium]